jgi:hypothetical protein
MKFMVFFFLWIPVGALSAFITPAFFTLYGLISPLFAKYNIKNSKIDKNVSNFIYDNLVYKKFFFFILATLSLFTNGIKYLGNNAIVGIIIAIIFAYFMGLYTNEMPEPGTDGFSFKIRQHMKQCKVFDRDNNEPKLVEICERIPIDDEKMEELISRGLRRGLTKPKEVGGDGDYDYEEEFPSAEELIKPSDQSLEQIIEPSKPSSSQLEILQNKLNELGKELAETEQLEIYTGKETMDKQYELRRIKNEIDAVNKEIQSLSQGQLGGKKHKKLNNKKFNIRWT